MGEWRGFLRKSGDDIWTVIRELIAVAASEYPDELRRHRDSYAEQMFSLPARRSGGCDAAKSSLQGGSKPPSSASRKPDGRARVYGRDEEEEEEEEEEVEGEGEEQEQEEARQQLEDCEDIGSDGGERGRLDPVNYSYDDYAEELTRALDAEKVMRDQIACIKKNLSDPDMLADDLVNLLRRLEDMHITVDVLRQTELAKKVVPFKRHASKQVRELARELIRVWKSMVNGYLKSANSFGSAACPHLVDGLPSPPLDGGELLAAPPNVPLDQFFADFFDDESAGSGEMNCRDVDLRTSAEASSMAPIDDFVPPRVNLKKTERRSLVRISSSPEAEPELRESRDRAAYTNGMEMKGYRDGEGAHKNAAQAARQNRDSIKYATDELDHGNTSRKVSRQSNGYREFDEALTNGSQTKRSSEAIARKFEQKPAASKPKLEKAKPLPTKSKSPEISVAERLEAAKRKLHERYEEAEAAKKSRTVQVMDLHELPKGGPNRARHPHSSQKPKPQVKSWAVRR